MKEFLIYVLYMYVDMYPYPYIVVLKARCPTR